MANLFRNLLWSFIFSFLVFGIGQTTLAYNQNFDSLNVGDISGQDSWTGGTTWDIGSNNPSSQGGKNTEFTGGYANVERIIGGETSGAYRFRMRSNATAVGYFILSEGASQKILIRYNSTPQITANGNVSQSYVAGTWYENCIEFNNAVDTYDFYVDDILKNTGVAYGSVATNLDTIRFDTDAGGNVTAIDDIRSVVSCVESEESVWVDNSWNASSTLATTSVLQLADSFLFHSFLIFIISAIISFEILRLFL